MHSCGAVAVTASDNWIRCWCIVINNFHNLCKTERNIHRMELIRKIVQPKRAISAFVHSYFLNVLAQSKQFNDGASYVFNGMHLQSDASQKIPLSAQRKWWYLFFFCFSSEWRDSCFMRVYLKILFVVYATKQAGQKASKIHDKKCKWCVQWYENAFPLESP